MADENYQCKIRKNENSSTKTSFKNRNKSLSEGIWRPGLLKYGNLACIIRTIFTE